MDRRKFLFIFSASLLSAPCLSPADARREKYRTGLVYDPLFLRHLIGSNHPESPERLRILMQLAESHGVLERVLPISLKADVADHIKQLHDEGHMRSLMKDHPVSERVAAGAVAGVLAAVDRVCSGEIENAFCALRPPGHHALNTGRIEGFCLYNTIAIAARYAQRACGLERILIVDWDYHHGNATETMFYSDPSVLFFSTHDLHAYPGTGYPDRKGEGRGLGYNINVHLDCGAGDDRIIAAFEQILVPAAAKFKPELMLISAGFDSRRDDPLGCFDVSDRGFIALTEIVMQLADEYCGGRIISMLEGGYNLMGNARAAIAHVSTLMNFQ